MFESDGESGDVVEATLDDGGAGRFARVAAGESAEFGDPKDDLGDGGRRERFWVRPLLVLLSEGDSGHEFPLGEDVGGGGVRFVPGEVFETFDSSSGSDHDGRPFHHSLNGSELTILDVACAGLPGAVQVLDSPSELISLDDFLDLFEGVDGEVGE